MNAFKAWANVVLFGGLGIAVLMDVRIPKDPQCIGRCYLDTMAHLQEDIGNGNLALILFASGLFGFFWYTSRD